MTIEWWGQHMVRAFVLKHPIAEEQKGDEHVQKIGMERASLTA